MSLAQTLQPDTLLLLQTAIGVVMQIVNAQGVLIGAAKGNANNLTVALNKQLRIAASGVYFLRFVHNEGVQIINR